MVIIMAMQIVIQSKTLHANDRLHEYALVTNLQEWKVVSSYEGAVVGIVVLAFSFSEENCKPFHNTYD